MVYLEVVATGIIKLRNHLLGTSTQVRACNASSQAFLAVRDELLGVHQQQWQQPQQQQTCEQQQQRWVQRGQHQRAGLREASYRP